MKRSQILAATLLEGISPAKAQRRKGRDPRSRRSSIAPLRLCGKNLRLILRAALFLIIAAPLSVGLAGSLALAKTSADVPAGKPEAMIDLATNDGLRSVKGEWRYSDTKIVEVDFVGAGRDKQPTGAPVKTYDYTPHAGGADFDDSKWEVIAPTTLDQRRGKGRLGFN